MPRTTGSAGYPHRPRCRHCNLEIYATPEETKGGYGWIHQRSNAERCATPARHGRDLWAEPERPFDNPA